jgi:hypothetical protein
MQQHTWQRVAWMSGTASVACYFMAAFLPLPGAVARTLAFAFGPLLSVSFLGLYRYLASHRDGPVLQIACLFGVIAGVMVTTMLVVQVGNNMVRADLLAEVADGAPEESIQVAWGAVNRVQYLVDVVWDIFICGAAMLLAVSLFTHPRFGKVWGGVGFLAGLLLLVLNLQTFPEGPAYAGSVDLGPVVAVWMLAVFVRLSLIRSV